MRHITIKRPKWLHRSSPGKTLDLYRQGKLPECIAGWMILVSLKQPLRAVYGSDLRAALALLWQATGERVLEGISNWIWCNVTHRAEAEELRKDAADLQ